MEEGPGLIELTGGGRALRQADLIQLVDGPEVAPLPPGEGAWVGLANLRGEVIPVADLGLLAGTGRIVAPVLAAIRGPEGAFGLLIEGVERTVEEPGEGEVADDPLPGDPAWLVPAPPGRPRVIDPALLLEDPGLGASR
jgi:hypothetical protein